MNFYEYKLVPTPDTMSKNQSLPQNDDAFSWALLEDMNALGRDGWEFLRTETVTNRRQASGWFRRPKKHEYMVYRRPLHSPAIVDKGRLESRAGTPNSKELKSRINTILQDETASTAKARSARSSFEVVKSHLKN